MKNISSLLSKINTMPFAALGLRVKILGSLMLVCFLTLSCAGVYSLGKIHAAKNEAISAKLQHAAMTIIALVGESYFEHAIAHAAAAPTGLQQQQYEELLVQLDTYATANGLSSIYAFTVAAQEIVFILDSANQQEIQNAFFGNLYEVYHSPPPALHAVIQQEQPQFANYSDQFGDFRSVFIPYRTPSGQFVILGADISLQQLKAEMAAMLLYYIGFALLTFVLFSILSELLVRAIYDPIKPVITAAKEIAKGNYRFELPKYQGVFGLLSSAMLAMRNVIAMREEQLKNIAFKDVLTGLPNRRGAADLFQSSLDNHQAAVVAVIEICNLDDINLMLGFEQGNKVQFGVARQLQAIGLPLLHLNSKTFALIDTQSNDLYPAINKTLGKYCALTGQYITTGDDEDHNVFIEFRVGMAVFPEHGQQAEDLLRCCDLAIRYAARQKLDAAFYSPIFLQEQESSFTLLREINRGLANHEFRLYFQPKLNLLDNKVVGVEALIRWAHPTRGLLAPGQFIEAAEVSGKIRDITLWVIRECLLQTQQQPFNSDITLSVNVTAQDIEHEAFIDKVSGLIAQTGGDPARIYLEITESGFIEHNVHVSGIFAALKQFGFRLSVDDFGTGYSSLSQLVHLPVDEIKIDRSFIASVDTKEGYQIVKCIVDLGLSLGKSLVAEGIEQPETATLLKQLHCDIGQGYLYSRPIPQESFAGWLQSYPATLSCTLI